MYNTERNLLTRFETALYFPTVSIQLKDRMFGPGQDVLSSQRSIHTCRPQNWFELDTIHSTTPSSEQEQGLSPKRKKNGQNWRKSHRGGLLLPVFVAEKRKAPRRGSKFKDLLFVKRPESECRVTNGNTKALLMLSSYTCTYLPAYKCFRQSHRKDGFWCKCSFQCCPEQQPFPGVSVCRLLPHTVTG